MDLIIVESLAKAKTIGKYLDAQYKVIASAGHIRDLINKDGAVEPEKNFLMHYTIIPGAQKYIDQMLKAIPAAKTIYLATDPDIEGESIAWHIADELKKKRNAKNVDFKRISFNEVTKSAVQKALAHPREIDLNLVSAQKARRALDYLVGFNISPILWRKLPGSKSAGRVQSVALRLICERENEIQDFVAQEYWSIQADFQTDQKQSFTASLTTFNNQKLEKLDIKNQETANQIAEVIKKNSFYINDIVTKQVRRNPVPPLITSTLQQEASTTLGFSAKKTMQIAQKLYEGVLVGSETIGLITYMRTDGTYIANEAIAQIRELIANNYGPQYLSKSVRLYQNKVKNAQEAHEAIRPTNVYNTPENRIIP